MTGRSAHHAAILLVLTALTLAPRPGIARDSCDPRLADRIPARPADAPAGAQVLSRLQTLPPNARDDAIGNELLAGNLPHRLRLLAPVPLIARPRGGDWPQVILCVTPDYLAIGSDRDHVLTPMGLPTALTIARQFDFFLPTRTMVDAIHRAATVRLQPRPLPAGAAMQSVAWMEWHQDLIRSDRPMQSAPPDALVAGHKKDLVLTRRLQQSTGRVAIYGWHRLDGRPIQPLSTVHGERYADYSHGVRLVAATAYVDGVPRTLRSLLDDPELGVLLHDEGPGAALGTLFEQLRPALATGPRP